MDGGASVESGDGNQSGIHRPSETLRPRSRTVPPRLSSLLFLFLPYSFHALSYRMPPSHSVLPTVQESSWSLKVEKEGGRDGDAQRNRAREAD